jgi:serine/threonine-protein kinase ATR
MILTCLQAVFRVLDYCSLWRSRKQAQTPTVPPEESRAFALDRMAHLFELIPPDLIAKRSIDCKQYARALQHLEPWIEHMSLDDLAPAQRVWVNDTLLDLYANIDDPDGIEGLSAKTPLQLPLQILGHKKAGRWTEAQTWYEVQLAADPENLGVQLELLTCLKESGQHGEC